MEEMRRPWWSTRRSKLLLASTALLLLPLSYALSLGPVDYCRFRGWLSPDVQDATDAVYAPMFWGAPYRGVPAPRWWPQWYRQYIDEFQAAGIKAYNASPEWEEELRQAEFEAKSRRQEAAEARQEEQTEKPAPEP